MCCWYAPLGVGIVARDFGAGFPASRRICPSTFRRSGALQNARVRTVSAPYVALAPNPTRLSVRHDPVCGVGVGVCCRPGVWCLILVWRMSIPVIGADGSFSKFEIGASGGDAKRIEYAQFAGEDSGKPSGGGA